MKFPVTPDECHEFYQFLHMQATGYHFEGGYKMFPTSLGNVERLWYVEDSIQFRLTDMGLWVGEPREHNARGNWLVDTSHDFKDAYELLLRVTGNLLPAGRRPRPTPARV